MPQESEVLRLLLTLSLKVLRTLRKVSDGSTQRPTLRYHREDINGVKLSWLRARNRLTFSLILRLRFSWLRAIGGTALLHWR